MYELKSSSFLIRIFSICMLAIVLSLTACGQKGTLYLPHEGQTVNSPSSSSDSSSDNSSGQVKKGHEQDKFLMPVIEEEIQQRIEKMKADPNDY